MVDKLATRAGGLAIGLAVLGGVGALALQHTLTLLVQ